MLKYLIRLIFFIALGAASAAPAHAQLLQQRQLPAQGQRGELGIPLALPLVQIGNAVLRLAPGAVMYDQQNRSIVHASLPPAAPVWYTVDAQGNVQRLYVLTPAEQARLDAMTVR